MRSQDWRQYRRYRRTSEQIEVGWQGAWRFPPPGGAATRDKWLGYEVASVESNPGIPARGGIRQ